VKKKPERREEKRVVHGVARWISKFGLMSRTEAERCVAAGRVALNGKQVLDPERACHPDRDRILVDGHPLKPARRIYIAMNKPTGYITTASDPHGRRTVHELLPPGTGPVQAVGRLDSDTSGLLLFTNDTELAARITDGHRGVEKVYEARLQGRVDEKDRRRFERGVELDGKMTLPARCKILESGDDSTRVELTITEGRNRQIRRMWDIIGRPVLELKRTRIGPISLGGLPLGRTRPVSEFERATLIVTPD
jgi:23S rRNA pseudouridine2605 synthase